MWGNAGDIVHKQSRNWWRPWHSWGRSGLGWWLLEAASEPHSWSPWSPVQRSWATTLRGSSRLASATSMETPRSVTCPHHIFTLQPLSASSKFCYMKIEKPFNSHIYQSSSTPREHISQSRLQCQCQCIIVNRSFWNMTLIQINFEKAWAWSFRIEKCDCLAELRVDSEAFEDSHKS